MIKDNSFQIQNELTATENKLFRLVRFGWADTDPDSRAESLMDNALDFINTRAWGKVFKCVEQAHKLDGYAIPADMLTSVKHMVLFMKYHNQAFEIMEVK